MFIDSFENDGIDFVFYLSIRLRMTFDEDRVCNPAWLSIRLRITGPNAGGRVPGRPARRRDR